EILAIADDSAGDVLDNGKGGQQGNMAAVGRSKLKAEMRAGLLRAWMPEIYGERPKTQVTVTVNYAEQLEAARTRAKVRDKAPASITRDQMRRAVEATFTEVSTAAVSHETEVVVEQPVGEAKDLWGLDD